MEENISIRVATKGKSNSRLDVIRECRAALRESGVLETGCRSGVGSPCRLLAIGVDELLAGQEDWENKGERLIVLEATVRYLGAQLNEQAGLFNRILDIIEQR